MKALMGEGDFFRNVTIFPGNMVLRKGKRKYWCSWRRVATPNILAGSLRYLPIPPRRIYTTYSRSSGFILSKSLLTWLKVGGWVLNSVVNVRFFGKTPRQRHHKNGASAIIAAFIRKNGKARPMIFRVSLFMLCWTSFVDLKGRFTESSWVNLSQFERGL